jgi:hypothetical protein
MEPAITGHEAIDHDDLLVHTWRVARLTRLGIPALLLSWTSAVVNSPTGGPELAQIVTVRDIGEEAQIAHLELTDQERAIVGHELVFTAIHKAARHGIQRLYSPRTVAHVEPFGFSASTDRPGTVVYNITSQEVNWPEELSPNVAT